MRKQSINIYLTVLALYDNGVLIFSILMLNLPAIADYQQMSTLHSSSFTFMPSNTSISLSNGTIINQLKSTNHSIVFDSVNDQPSITTQLDTGQEWLRTIKNMSTLSSSTLSLSSSTSKSIMPEFTSQSVPSVLSLHNVTKAETETMIETSTIWIRPEINFTNEQMKRSKRRPPPSTSTFLFGLNTLKSCFNLTENDLYEMKRNMILNTTLGLSQTSMNDEKTKSNNNNNNNIYNERQLNLLFFEALYRQLILWIQNNLNQTIVSERCRTSLHSNPTGQNVSVSLMITLEQIYNGIIGYGSSSSSFDRSPNAEHFIGDDDDGIEMMIDDDNEMNEQSSLTINNVYPLITYVKIVYPLALISQTGSIWTTCLITVERYLAVCHPLMSLTLSTRSRAIWALSILSLIALVFNLPRFFEVDTTDYGIRPSDLRQNKIYYNVYYICLNLSLNYILPLSLLFTLNIKIYASVRHANTHRNELTRARQSELHLASMLVLIVAIFIACNAPAFLIHCMELYLDAGNQTFEAITIFSNVLVCFNSAINFVIYCIFGKKFRSKLKLVLGIRGARRNGRQRTCWFRFGSSGSSSSSRRRTDSVHQPQTNRQYLSQNYSIAESRNSSFRITNSANHPPSNEHPSNENGHNDKEWLEQQLSMMTDRTTNGSSKHRLNGVSCTPPTLNVSNQDDNEVKCSKFVNQIPLKDINTVVVNGTSTDSSTKMLESHFYKDRLMGNIDYNQWEMNTFV